MKKGLLVFLIFFTILNQNAFSQQNVFHRSDAGTNNWWDGANPWFYQTWNSNEPRPDRVETTRNFVNIGHNNNTSMNVNGAFFGIGSLDLQAGASTPRTFSPSSGGGISLTIGLYNNSSGNHSFSTPIGVDATTVDFTANSSGSLSFSNNFFLNANTARFGGSSTGNITVSGVLQGSGNLVKSGTNSLTLSSQNTYTGLTTINGGTLILNRSGGSTLHGANNVVVNSGGTLKISSAQTLNDVTVAAGGVLEIDNGITLTVNGTINIAGSVTGTGIINATASSANVNISGGTVLPTQLGTSVRGLTISSGTIVALGSDLTISGALTLTSGTLSIGSNTLTLAGTVSRTSGFLRGSNSSNLVVQGSTAKTLDFDQSTDGSHQNPTTGTNSLNNLTLSANGNLKLGNKVNLYGTLSSTAGISLDLGDGLLVFRNTATTTARIADLTAGAGTITGTAISEIYLHAQRRAWRFITNPTPISGGTIANNWQSNFGLGNNYGTNIYGPAATNGLNSPATVSASMMKFNSNLNTTGGYDNITNTGDDLNGTYFLFVRGDKNVVAVPNGTPAAFTQTTLASKGTIKTGTQTINLNTTNAGRYGAIPNPYLSPVDVSLLTYNNIDGSNASYHWNPNKGGTNFGGWETINSGTWSGITDFRRYMQTGQSALVLMNNATASVVFEEADKVSNKTTQQTGAGNGLNDKLLTSLIHVDANGVKENVDELYVIFKSNANTNFSSSEDAVKMNNSGENLSSKRNNTLIAIEARPYIQNHDSIFMSFTNTRVANYEFEFDPSNFDATVLDAKLVDKFLNTETPLSLSAKTTVPFSVTATTGSNAADRFMIVFRGTGALPNKGFTVTGEKLGTNKVKVNWEAQAETGVREYALEKSTDGVNYQTVNTQAAKNGNVSNSYTYTDNTPVNGVNYYRVKTTQHNDIERYSTVIIVNFKQQGTNNIVVYPNPVKGNTIGLQLQDLEKGMYSVRILSIEGKEVYKQQLQVNGSSLNTTINPSTKLAQGTYTLQVVGKSTTYTQKVVVE